MGFSKLKAFYSVFTKGQVVANAIALKQGQVTAGMVSALLAATVTALRLFGVDLHVTDDQLLQLGGAVVIVLGLFNSGATLASTKLIGLPQLPGPAGPVDSPSEPELPEIHPQFHDTLPPIRHAANGDPIDPAARRE